MDDELELNLESFCRQTHPRYEIIVGAADPEDPALDVARRVKARHPKTPFRIVSGQWPTGSNPKVRNLRNMLSSARYANILVSDGDVRVGCDYLSVMAGAIERPNVGLVSNLIVGQGERTIGASCENAQFNGFVAAATAAAMLIARHPIVVGKSMLFRRDALTNAGGFAAAANVLAEDYLLGRAVAHAGYRVEVLGYRVVAISQKRSLRRMLQRQLRWAQIRRQVAPATFALEPLGYPCIWLVLTLLALLASPQVQQVTTQVAAAASVVLGAAVTVQSLVAQRLRGGELRIVDSVILPLASGLALLAWIRAWSEDVIIWRDQRFRIGRGSKLSPIAELTPQPAERLPEAA